MAVNLSPVGGVAAQFFDNAGNVLTGGKLYTYAAGTTTPQITYTTSAGNVAWSNPIILDAAGRVSGSGEIWLSDGIQYKFILRDSNDVLIATYDNVIGINSNFVNFTNEQEIQTATAGQTIFSLTTMQYSPGTNSLTVFVDGVNQYGPGAQYAYLETDSDTVTFVNGLHVGALVKFTTSQLNSSSGVDAQQVSYTYPAIDAVAQNVEERLAQYVSVKDFGAVGDGITDDTAAIQDALTAAALDGKAVLIPGTPNSYLCGPLSIPTSIIGQDHKTSKFTRKTGTTGVWLNVTANAVSISNLYLDGAYVAHRCIEVDGYNDVTITNNIARQIGEYFVHFNNADRLVVSSNNYKDGSNGIANLMPVDSAAAIASVDVKIIGNHIENIFGSAIHFAGKQSSTDPLFAWVNPLTTNGVISENTINNVDGNGIIAQSYYLTISNNTIKDTGNVGGNQGIVPQGRYISVIGNIVDGGAGVGIDMGGCDSSVVSGNVVRLQAQIGIELQSCTNTTCVGNSVVDCGFGITGEASAGIAVLEGFFGPTFISFKNLVTGNTVSSGGSSGQYGISVGAGVEQCIVSGNNLTDSATVRQLFVSATAKALCYGNLTATTEENLFEVFGPNVKFVARSPAGNTDFWMFPEGTGTLRVQKFMGTATTPANFSAVSFLPIKDQTGNVFYIPLATGTW
jgi:parallel beta-helix repeat protein